MDDGKGKREFLKPIELARELGVSRSFIYGMMRNGLRFIQLAGTRRIRRADIEKYLEQHVVNG